MCRISVWLLLFAFSSAPAGSAEPFVPDAVRPASGDSTAEGQLVPIGAAIVDITPDYPVRLAGYARRMAESDGITARIHTRALVTGGEFSSSEQILRQPLAVLVTVDNCGVPADVTEAVFERLSSELALERSHFVVSPTHTHSAPWLRGFAPLIQSQLTPRHQAHMERYERELKERLVEVVLAAVQARRPGQLSIGFGRAEFAKNRRVIENGRWVANGVEDDGPVDHRLPILAAHDKDGALIAVLAGYACHATTNAGSDNRIGGDWPGFAADMIEQDHPGAVALVAVGCGADINPVRSRDEDYSADHGRTFADSVHRVLHNQPGADETSLQPLDPRLRCQLSRIQLPFGPLPSRSEWEAQAEQGGVAAELAKQMLGKLDSGEGIPSGLTDYPVQTWCFGNDLAMVFLAGEVVLDYAIRMSDMFDSGRLWVNAYCNDVPCYIPSKRVLREGGYEAESSLKHYGRPARLSPEIEDRICWTVQKQLPHSFYSKELLTEYPGPESPDDALATMSTRKDLRVELVAAEPLIQDPVAFDWDPSGRLWVVEMGDYPTGPKGGRVRVLEDQDGDGRYDAARTFLDGLPFPSGICVWRDGVIVTAAPDLLYAEDTNGDGRADRTTVLFTGFGEGNQQHRVNGLRWGLDGWLYLANGDSGGRLQAVGKIDSRSGLPTKVPAGTAVNIRFRDLRLRPDEGRIEAISGQTQFGRERDDFGNWFGNNNANPIWHYTIEDRYVQRNPFTKIGMSRTQVSFKPGSAPVYPTSRTVARFNDFYTANRFTSACSTAIYRDTMLGKEFHGNAFTCEPVHNLVSRLVLSPRSVTFHGVRADDEAQSEFLASSDNWCRPTMIRTGPDGAIYVCDMYRQVIEHPQWIPVEAQRRLNLRAGKNMGRIYRVVRKDSRAPEPNWWSESSNKVPLAQVVEQLASPNGWWRDTAQRILQHRLDFWDDKISGSLPWNHERAEVRVQAVCTAAMAGRLADRRLLAALEDPDARVRRRAIPLMEDVELPAGELVAAINRLKNDSDAGVRFQLACTLGSLSGPAAAEVLGELFVCDYDKEWIRKAALSSLNADNVVTVFRIVSDSDAKNGPLVAQLIEQCHQLGRSSEILEPIINLLNHTAADATNSPNDMATAAQVVEFVQQTDELAESVAGAVRRVAARASTILQNESSDPEQQLAAIDLLAATEEISNAVAERLSKLLRPAEPVDLQKSALEALLRTGLVDRILQAWSALSPARREQTLNFILSRDESVRVLLARLEDQSVSAGDIGAIYRDQLLNHRNSQIREQANELLGIASSQTRSAIVEDWSNRIAERTGNSSAGQAVFRKHCATCHKLQDTGQEAGTSLEALRDRSTHALVAAILDPNKAVETKFLSYTALTNDGLTISGMLQSETGNSVTLLGTDGKPQQLLRSNLQQLIASNRSFMPEGLEKDLSPQELADVIAFVQAAGTPWNQFAGNYPRVVSAGGDGLLTLTASSAELYGPSIVFEQQSGKISEWKSSDDYVVWKLNVPKLGFWKVEFDYVCDDSAAGNLFRLATRGRMMSARVPGTGTNKTWRKWMAGAVELFPGPITLTLSAPKGLTSSLIELRAIRLTPPDAE